MANKRLLRSIEDKFLGGICGGLANYFGFEHTWLIRLLFLVSIFWFGASIWIYLLLWIILPKQKISDLISQSHLEEKKEATDEFEPISGFLKKMYFLFISIVKGIIRLISRFAGVFLLIFTVFATMLFFSSFNFNFGDTFQINGGIQSLGFKRIIAFVIPKSFNLDVLYYAVVIAVIIPLFYLFFLSLILMRNKIKIPNFIHVLTVVFLALDFVYLTIQFKVFKQEFGTKTEKNQTIPVTSNGEYWYISPLNTTKNIGETHLKLESNHKGVLIADSGIFIKNITILIERGSKKQAEILYTISAFGKDERESEFNQKTIQYNFSQENNQLHFPNYFKIPLTQLWRNQAIKMVLKFPVHSKIKLDVFMDEFDLQINGSNSQTNATNLGGKILEIKEDEILISDEFQPN
jgi:phage shock protein PspC (stress-responsive transcriptional regulator)